VKDREKTDLLTKIGYLWLELAGCFAISTEVNVPYHGLRDWGNHQDRHYIIDLVGVKYRYLPAEKQYKEKYTYMIGDQEHQAETTINKILETRGIEVKVSRGDFHNGFIHCGCDYHYLMTPKGLIKKKEVKPCIGLIEVDLEAFHLKKIGKPWYTYELEGLEVTKKPRRLETRSEGAERILAQVPETLTNQTKRWLKQSLTRG